MDDYIVAKKKSTIALAGGRAFFMPAGIKQESNYECDNQNEP